MAAAAQPGQSPGPVEWALIIVAPVRSPNLPIRLIFVFRRLDVVWIVRFWHDVLVTTGQRNLRGSARASGNLRPADLVVREVILPKRRVFLQSNLQLVLQCHCSLQPERCNINAGRAAGRACRQISALATKSHVFAESAAAEQPHYSTYVSAPEEAKRASAILVWSDGRSISTNEPGGERMPGVGEPDRDANRKCGENQQTAPKAYRVDTRSQQDIASGRCEHEAPKQPEHQNRLASHVWHPRNRRPHQSTNSGEQH